MIACGDCRWWKRPEQRDDFGYTSTDDETDNTQAEFGCVLGQSK